LPHAGCIPDAEFAVECSHLGRQGMPSASQGSGDDGAMIVMWSRLSTGSDGRMLSEKKPTEKEKGPLAMSKRPKSREETPTKGGDSARRYRNHDM